MENNKVIKSIGQAYQQVQEKLKGGQKKLDKDGDGDIDGTDFAMMRKKKKMDEDNHDKVECPKCKVKDAIIVMAKAIIRKQMNKDHVLLVARLVKKMKRLL